MKKVWIMVADEAIARIFECGPGGTDIHAIHELTDAAARAEAKDLRREPYGKRGMTVTSSAGDSEKHIEADQFAARVGKWLEDALNKHRFDELHIAAAPRFLGYLRKELPPPVAHVVHSELDKDLTHIDNAEAARRIFSEGRPTSHRDAA